VIQTSRLIGAYVYTNKPVKTHAPERQLTGRYSLQAPVNCHMGGIYGFPAPHPEMPRRPGDWQGYDVVLVRRVIPGITGGALDSREGQSGPILLQGDHGAVSYRNIVVVPALP